MKNLLMIFLFSFIFCGLAKAQNIEVRGTVTSTTDNEPLIGVNVSIKDQPIGTITDIDGNYYLSVPPAAVPVFSYIGYDSQEANINGKTVINMQLKESSLLC